MLTNLVLLSLLTVDVGYYLPTFTTINVFFMKDILSMRKKAIKVTEVKHLYVPQYESLSCAKILEYAENH